MNALELISFLLPPQRGKIRALNSPFDADVFSAEHAQRWIDHGKAFVMDGVLVFRNEFTIAMHDQHAREEQQAAQDHNYDEMCDLTQSGGKRSSGSIAEWRVRPTGRGSNTPGAPKERTWQMRRVWR